MDSKSRREILKNSGVLIAGAAAVSLLPTKKAVAASKDKLPRWAMIMDLRRCIGCRACTLACKAEFNVPLGSWNAVVKDLFIGKHPNNKKYFIPRLCNHCGGKEDMENPVPPCVKECPEVNSGKRAKLGKVRYRTGATYKRPDGAILLDNSLCIGCGKCIEACPYGVRYFNPFEKLKRKDREKDIGIGKCTFCQHRIDNGVIPACVNTCPGDARIFGDLNDPESSVSKLAKEFNLLKNRDKTTLLHKEDTVPFVFYIDPDKALKNYKFKKEEKEAEFRDQIV